MCKSQSDAFVAFREVTGQQPRVEKLIEVDAHEGPVYIPDDDALYFASVSVETDYPSVT